MSAKLLNFSIPTTPNERKWWGNIRGCAQSIAIAEAASAHKGVTLVLVPDFSQAYALEQELKFFLSSELKKNITHFPDWETLPYDSFSPHQDIVSERLQTLYQLPNQETGILIVPVTTFMQRVCPQSFIVSNSLVLKVGDKLQLNQYQQQLQKAGYRHSPQTMEHGEFSIRGSLLDIYPMGMDKPVRIDLFDDCIDSIRTFDPETQRSIDNIDRINCLPGHEFPIDDQAISQFRNQWRERFSGDPRQCPVYVDISQGIASPGIEYYIPLFFEQMASLADFLPENTLIVRCGALADMAQEYWQQIEQRYQQYRHDIQRPLLEPKQLYWQPDALWAQLKAWPSIQLSDTVVDDKAGRVNLSTALLPDLSINNHRRTSFSELKKFLQDFSGRVLLTVDSIGRREVVTDMLTNAGLQPAPFKGWNEFFTGGSSFGLCEAQLNQGIIIEGANIAIVPESSLFGQRVAQRRRNKQVASEQESSIRNLAELQINDPVVHIDHGVARYLGLIHLSLEGTEGEFVCLEYQDGDKLYIPVSSLHLISRYSGTDSDKAPYSRLGTDKWSKEKRKTLEKIRDVAADLLDLYAKREAKPGKALPMAEEEYLNFASQFPFEETLDQQKAIDDVINDLRSPRPMDRVICGDVGFGKTEVAMRAAYLVVAAGKQVAILVPTTLLAEQHFQSFQDRFAEFGVNIDLLSRFRSKKQQDETLARIAAGSVDIVIGTHKLIMQDIYFKNLGLFVIDEEHRFGVRQKEKLKKLRSEVDILTLTATPIPRTLNMAMSGIRDLSIIATPPMKRLSIKTFVREHNPALITEAIQRELLRGGQVYYLHNSVETIHKTAEQLAEWLPNARIAVAHGQMPERALEQIMSQFYHRQYNVLVCTTIIETGIDIPTANTIIIDRADKLGLAQLHQLRGRVGRSHHQAYAFCLCPSLKGLKSDARKRLDAICQMETLGAGFTLATHDLEIRGAGELLGDEQSGQIQAIGFSLYMELLEAAVKRIQRGESLAELPLERGAEIDLHCPALIPDKYLPDLQCRLIFYKRIANADDEAGLQHLQVEMIDRFGPLPEPTKQLFKLTNLKLQCNNLGVIKIKANANGGVITFNKNPRVDPRKVIDLIQKQPKQFAFEGGEKLRFKMEMTNPQERCSQISRLLERLAMSEVSVD